MPPTLTTTERRIATLLGDAWVLLARARRGCILRGEDRRERHITKAMAEVAHAEGWIYRGPGPDSDCREHIDPIDPLAWFRRDLAGDTATEKITEALGCLVAARAMAAQADLQILLAYLDTALTHAHAAAAAFSSPPRAPDQPATPANRIAPGAPTNHPTAAPALPDSLPDWEEDTATLRHLSPSTSGRNVIATLRPLSAQGNPLPGCPQVTRRYLQIHEPHWLHGQLWPDDDPEDGDDIADTWEDPSPSAETKATAIPTSPPERRAASLLDEAWGLLARARSGCVLRGERQPENLLTLAMGEVAYTRGWLRVPRPCAGAAKRYDSITSLLLAATGLLVAARTLLLDSLDLLPAARRIDSALRAINSAFLSI